MLSPQQGLCSSSTRWPLVLSFALGWLGNLSFCMYWGHPGFHRFCSMGSLQFSQSKPRAVTKISSFQVSARPFYSCGLSTLAFEWMWGSGWPCFDTNLFCFVMEIVLENTSKHKNNLIYIIKQKGLYQNKVTSSLASIHNCKMTY